MNFKLGKNSFQEIMNQDQAWQTVLSDLIIYNQIVSAIKNEKIDKVLFTGCGSSYYISLSASFIFTKLTGIDSRAVPASEIIFYPEVHLPSQDKTLLLAISRSGRTTEVVKAVEGVKSRKNFTTVALSCYEDSQLAEICDFTLLSRDGKEKSVVMTKSFSSLLLGIQLFSGLWAENKEYLASLNQLPQCYRENIISWCKLIEDYIFTNQFNKYGFLGQGNFYGIANEAMLKMKEMALVNSEDFHSLEFRHGPKSIVDHNMLVTIYLADHTYASEKKLIKELVDYEARVMIISNQTDRELKGLKQLIIDLKTELSQFVLTPIFLVPSQLVAYYTAVKKGIDVDHPRYLTPVVENI